MSVCVCGGGWGGGGDSHSGLAQLNTNSTVSEFISMVTLHKRSVYEWAARGRACNYVKFQIGIYCQY